MGVTVLASGASTSGTCSSRQQVGATSYMLLSPPLP
jgi:hypothetical protein